MADPHDANPELREHREGCEQCRLYTDELLRFETRLERALRIELPATHNVRTFVRDTGAKPPRWRWLALAASVLLGVMVAGGIWLAPQRSLATAVVAHMAGEPDAWRRTDIAVPAPTLNRVLRESKVGLKYGGIVSYASSCEFRGHHVPHLVVQTDMGPVTVMVLVHESVDKPMQFDEQGYRGTIVPDPGHGSIAVLMRDPDANSENIQRVAARVRDSIVWAQ